MTMTGFDVFDRTLHKTNVWLKEIMAELGTEDRHRAYTALRATLQSLRDRLTVEEAAELGAQLPLLVRGIYYEAWNPAGKPLKERHREDFLARVGSHFTDQAVPLDPEIAARAVFKVMSNHVSHGEIEDVKHLLPEELRELWNG